MTSWEQACPLADMPDGGAVAVELGGEPLCLVRAEGQVYAIRDDCSHADIPLSEGDVEGTTVECWLHGSRFDLPPASRPGCRRPSPCPSTRPRSRATTVLVRLES